MSIVFAVAIYFIVWWLTLFTVLPFGLRTQGEAGEVVPGTPSSAPSRMNMLRVFGINTVVASVVFAVIWYLIVNDLLAADMFVFQDNSPV